MEMPGTFIRNWRPAIQNDRNSNSIPLVQDLEPVASYSWIHSKKKPTIVVPGCPPIWINKTYPFTVVPDEGHPYGDLNKAQVPQNHFLPLFLAIKICKPEFSIESSADFVTDKSILRSLLRWVKHEIKKDFRIDSELLGKSTLILSAPGSDKQYPPGLIRRNLEKAHTELPSGWEATFGHYRIINYKFGDLKLLVRYPVDICDPKSSENLMESLQLPNSLTSLETEEFQGLDFIQFGRLLDQSAMVELLIRLEVITVPWSNIWHQLYFSQSPTLFASKRQGQNFTGTDKFYLTSSTALTEEIKRSSSDLKSVEQILHGMRDIVTGSGHSQLSFVFPKNPREPVKIYQLVAPSFIVVY